EQVQKKMEEVKPDADGWRTLTYIFERPDEACMFVLGMGDSVDVVAPRELRARVLQVAKDVVVHYSG
ncbi:MAG: WYL domain-containing protein, partial [Chloroflexi bacterium]|nr:WYL domain-containing protein [Chloroflexota bacterium]